MFYDELELLLSNPSFYKLASELQSQAQAFRIVNHCWTFLGSSLEQSFITSARESPNIDLIRLKTKVWVQLSSLSLDSFHP